jgi:hypothetical protein
MRYILLFIIMFLGSCKFDVNDIACKSNEDCPMDMYCGNNGKCVKLYTNISDVNIFNENTIDIGVIFCKKDSDCYEITGAKCVNMMCVVPECTTDSDCINKGMGNKCRSWVCENENIGDAGMDIDTGGNDCTDNCSEKCKPNKICKNGYCIDYGNCQNDTDCPCNWHCNSFESRCEECFYDDDCKNHTDGKTKCDIGKTFICIEPPVCNPACDPNCQICKDGNCVLAPGKCCQDSDCPSNKCVNYVCEQSHTCGDPCSTDDECKQWCNDASFICNNNVCMPKGCNVDSDCDAQCGAGLGKCVSGTCQCEQHGNGTLCSACNTDSDCSSGFTCFEFTNPFNQSKYKVCTHSCTCPGQPDFIGLCDTSDCSDTPNQAWQKCIANNSLCSCLSAQ